jgi:hypothetical protein
LQEQAKANLAVENQESLFLANWQALSRAMLAFPWGVSHCFEIIGEVRELPSMPDFIPVK